MDIIPHSGWSRCARLSNKLVELIITLEVGPRIIRFGFIGGDNEVKEIPADLGQTGGTDFRFYGGHRLWHAPESKPRTYYPDNQPVGATPFLNGVHLIQPVETTTGIQKEMLIRLSPELAQVEIEHRLRNTNLWRVELAPWALTALAPGGTAILPLPPRGDHANNLLPANTLALWAYTNLSDPRWTWGQRYILLRQDPARPAPQKIGALLPEGWLGYARAGHLFLKQFAYVPGGAYPDLGCSAEVFTNDEMLELESLGPVTTLEPGDLVTHVERWQLFDGIPQVETEIDVDTNVIPRLNRSKSP